MTQLEKMFWDINSLYFHFGKKKLATLLGVEWANLKGLGVNREYRTLFPGKPWVRTTYKILIDRRQKFARRVWVGTLIHEMAHFKLQGVDKSRLSCGSRMFNKEMKRLANLGAFNGIW